jgi:hypothetical protein
MTEQAHWLKSARAGLREVLNEWDPIGIYGIEDPAPHMDEYDGIRDSLISRLVSGTTPAEITAFLREELRDHFGLSEALVTPDVVDRVFERWQPVARERAQETADH